MTEQTTQKTIEVEFDENEYYEGKKGVIKLSFLQKLSSVSLIRDNCEFFGYNLPNRYKISSRKGNIVFGVDNGIGNRMNHWAKVNRYIAINIKTSKILGILKREMGWYINLGQNVSVWKKEILNKYQEIKNDKNKKRIIILFNKQKEVINKDENTKKHKSLVV